MKHSKYFSSPQQTMSTLAQVCWDIKCIIEHLHLSFNIIMCVSIFWIIIPYFTKAMIAMSCTIGCQLTVAASGVQWGFKLKYGLFSRVRTNDEWPLHRKATSPTVLPATEILLLEVDALIYHSNRPSLWSAVTIQCTSWILFSPYY